MYGDGNCVSGITPGSHTLAFPGEGFRFYAGSLSLISIRGVGLGVGGWGLGWKMGAGAKAYVGTEDSILIRRRGPHLPSADH